MAQWRDLPPNLHSHEYGGLRAPHQFIRLPAYTVLPLLRAPLGYQVVHPGPAIKRALGLIILPLGAQAVWVGFSQRLPDNMGHSYLMLFALVSLGASLVVFARRWYGQRRGEALHSSDAGYSWLVWFTPLPVVLCELAIVPLAVFAVGYAFAHSVSWELGWWLMASGVSLFLMALWEHKRSWAQRRATTDDLVRAGAFEARVSRAAPPATAAKSKDSPDFADLA